MGEVASLSSVGRAPDCSCVKTNVSADIRVSPVQVWERGPHLQRSAPAWSMLTREVERLHLLPLSWERGLLLQPYGTSPLNREVERSKHLLSHGSGSNDFTSVSTLVHAKSRGRLPRTTSLSWREVHGDQQFQKFPSMVPDYRSGLNSVRKVV